MRVMEPSATTCLPKCSVNSSRDFGHIGSDFCNSVFTRAYTRAIYWCRVTLARSIQRIGDHVNSGGIDAVNGGILGYRGVVAIQDHPHPSVYALCGVGIYCS
jgi:hypothetical protein